MIRRLRIKGYKSLRDCTVELAPLSVILGPNGAGKSNLLDLIGLLSRLALRETVRDSFNGHRGRTLEAFHSAGGFGKDAYDALMKEERLSFSVQCDIELHPRIVDDVNRTLEERREASPHKATYTKVSERLLRYELEVTLHPKGGELFVTNECLRALRKDLKPKTSRQPFLEKKRAAGRERFIARVERQSHPRYFDLGRVRTLLSELSDPVYHPHVVAAAKEIASWRVYYVEPNQIRGEIGVQSADEPGRTGDLLAAYYYFLQQKHPATLRGIVKNLHEIVRAIEDLRVDVRDGLLEIVSVGRDGAEYPARLLSEGTLRLLCVLGIAVAPSPPAVVVYEEPENGVNPARLDLIADILRNATAVRKDAMQFIVTTHSALVCNLLPEHLIVCTWSDEHGTRFEPFPWNQSDLFFEQTVIEALDGAAGTPTPE